MAGTLQVRLLGGFEVRSGEFAVAPGRWRLRRARTLVKLLAVQDQHRLHRDRVIDALWPDADVDGARNNLHQVVHAARRAIATVGVDGAAAIGWVGDLLVLGATCDLVTDVEQLHDAVAAAGDDAAAVAAALQRAGGDLLPEDGYEPWAQAPVRAFREWRAQVVMGLVDAQLASGDAARAVALLAPVVAAEPLHEPAQRAMMRALAASGRRSEALLVFERLRGVLQEELAAEPEPDTRVLFRELLTTSAPAPATLPIPAQRRSGNLPVAVTGLIGRDRELAETGAALRRTRLLTLTGMGGAGKTTLALALARRRAGDFANGAHLVELGPLHDSGQVVTEVARVLGLDLPPDTPAVESLVVQLLDRHLLLVLDSCEHLLDACAALSRELLQRCPEVVVLATSREPLRIDGEVTWRTPSLALPDPEQTPDVNELAAVASVQLFVRRATAAAPTFSLTADNAAAVAEICYRLDGIPLALELAAACIPFLSPAQIAARLGDALNLLQRGDRAGVTRQQTLAATLTWSHDLLGDDERALFRRLGTFTGSFTLEAVDALSGAELGTGRTLAALARLVDTSLVVADFRGDTVRYRLLETVRQFADEQLRAAGETTAMHQRHCDFYLRYAETHDPQRAADSMHEQLAMLDLEHENLRLALTWALRHRPPAALRLAVALWRHWLTRGLFADGRRWLEDVLHANPAQSTHRAEALLALAVFDVRGGRMERLAELGAAAVETHRSLHDTAGLARALRADGVLAYMRGAWDECTTRSVESRAAALGDDDMDAITALHLQALVLSARGELEPANAALTAIRDALTRVRRPDTLFFPPLMLGFAVVRTGVPVARVYFEQTVLLGRLVNARQADGYVLCNLADVARHRGALDGAHGLLEDAVASFTAIGDRDGEAVALSMLGCLHRVRGAYADARRALEQSLLIRRGIGDRRAVGLTEANLAALLALGGDADAGCRLLDGVQAGFARTQDRAGLAGVAMSAASIHVELGRWEAAAEQLRGRLPEMARIPGNHRAVAWGHLMLGDVLERLGDADEAERVRVEAHRRFTALGAMDGIADVRARRQLHIVK